MIHSTYQGSNHLSARDDRQDALMARYKSRAPEHGALVRVGSMGRQTVRCPPTGLAQVASEQLYVAEGEFPLAKGWHGRVSKTSPRENRTVARQRKEPGAQRS